MADAIRKERTHKRGVESRQAGLSPEQIRRQKCASIASRHAIIKAERKEAQKSATPISPQEQLRRLDQRLGKGVGAKRERARLAGKVEG